MKYLLKNIKVKDKFSDYNNQTANILIVDGLISKIGSDTYKSDKEIDLKGACISPGFYDFRAICGEPGMEQRETLESFVKAANKGGFTGASILPNTSPIIQSSEQIESIQAKSEKLGFNLHPYAALSKDLKGEELTEILDLNKSGVKAFTDGEKVIDNADLLLKALKYTTSIDTLIINLPQDKNLRKKGMVREGEVSTKMGLPGIPSFSEVLMIQRDIKILEYTGGRIHFANVTTTEGLKEIEKAKKTGLNVTCDIAAHYLAFDESTTELLDSDYKVSPPFSSKKDIKFIQKCLKNGVIDIITSDHTPQNIEEKMLEYDKASFGISSIESTYAVANTFSGLATDELLDKLIYNPREILGLKTFEIKEGEQADFTVFSEDEIFEFDKTNMKSKSKNTPFDGMKLKGIVLGTVYKGYLNV